MIHGMNSIGRRRDSDLIDVAADPIPNASPVVRLPERGMGGGWIRAFFADQVDQRIDEGWFEFGVKLDGNRRLIIIGKDSDRAEIIAADQGGTGPLLDHLVLMA